MRRIVRLVLALSVLAGLAAPAALAAERMWVGFHDDPSFRWVGEPRRRAIARVRDRRTRRSCGCSCSGTSSRRRGRRIATDPFDPAYSFDDIDEAVRAAQENDQEVILTISGTPRWANGGKNPNVMPTRVCRLHRVLARDRVAVLGPLHGLSVRPLLVDLERAEPPALPQPAVRRAGQLGRAGELREARRRRRTRGSRPGTRARRSRSARPPRAGATSRRDCARRTRPGKFAELVAKANPRLKFDAWSHHPYPFDPNSPPSQVVRWPNVSLASLPRFDENLKKWFKRKSVPIWITEYGHQTKPPDSLGVSYSTQAAYIQQSISMAARLPVRRHVHLVRLPGRPGPAVGVGCLHARRRAERDLAGAVQRERAAARRAERRRRRPRAARSRRS